MMWPRSRLRLQAAVETDYQFVLIAGGSSAGSEDYSRKVIDSLGEVLVHGVTIMPGKPVLIGRVQGKPVFGVPGYPVSAIIAFEQFIGPMMLKMLGLPERVRERIMVEPIRKIASKLGVEEFLRRQAGQGRQSDCGHPAARGGAGSITSLTEADGIIRIPNHVEGLLADTPVQAELLRSVGSLEKTIVAVGSHDNTLDLIADRIKLVASGFTLSSSHVGSLGGLMAIRNGGCHVAGSHLLDTEDGSYNLSYIQKYLPQIPVRVVNLVRRDQGLMVPRGNPRDIKGIEDLGRDDVRFINRQTGSGTRILLDYQLQKIGLDPSDIQGYADEEFTHMAVAVSVLSGAADAGLGIYAAARALDLDFIPVITEHYDLVIPVDYFETEMIRLLMDIINSGDFQTQVRALGGYHTEQTGQIIL